MYDTHKIVSDYFYSSNFKFVRLIYYTSDFTRADLLLHLINSNLYMTTVIVRVYSSPFINRGSQNYFLCLHPRPANDKK